MLKNLKSIADVLEQDTLPFVVDEGVYQYIVDIYLHSPDMFTNIFPILGSFHMVKIACKCAGKYLRGSGIEDALIENEIFRPGVLDTVLSGKHYRSLKLASRFYFFSTTFFVTSKHTT